MGSVAGRLGYAFRTPYASTKWAIVGLMKSLAIELGPQGVRVNAILPGAGEEDPRAGARQPGEDAAHVGRAASRLETDHDVAALALFLCSPAARGLTGQAISVGGSTTSRLHAPGQIG